MLWADGRLAQLLRGEKWRGCVRLMAQACLAPGWSSFRREQGVAAEGEEGRAEEGSWPGPCFTKHSGNCGLGGDELAGPLSRAGFAEGFNS